MPSRRTGSESKHEPPVTNTAARPTCRHSRDQGTQCAIDSPVPFTRKGEGGSIGATRWLNRQQHFRARLGSRRGGEVDCRRCCSAGCCDIELQQVARDAQRSTAAELDRDKDGGRSGVGGRGGSRRDAHDGTEERDDNTQGPHGCWAYDPRSVPLTAPDFERHRLMRLEVTPRWKMA